MLVISSQEAVSHFAIPAKFHEVEGEPGSNLSYWRMAASQLIS
jgi:hypothetical protein